MKFSKQSPTFLESDEEYGYVFGLLKEKASKYGFYYKKYQKRHNAFISLCKFEDVPEVMWFQTCNLFRRSFTNAGLGYSFNTEKSGDLYQHQTILQTQIASLHMNQHAEPRMMSRASPKGRFQKFLLSKLVDWSINFYSTYPLVS